MEKKGKKSRRQHCDKIKFLSSNNPWNSAESLCQWHPPSGKLTYFLIQIRSVFAECSTRRYLTHFFYHTHKQYHGEINTQERAKVYLLDHFLDKFVGSFEVLWVRAIQQAGQHLTETVQSERTQLINSKRILQCPVNICCDVKPSLHCLNSPYFWLLFILKYSILGSGWGEVQ